MVDDDLTAEADRRMTYCDECGPYVKARRCILLPTGGAPRYCIHHTVKHKAALDEMGAATYTLSGD